MRLDRFKYDDAISGLTDAVASGACYNESGKHIMIDFIEVWRLAFDGWYIGDWCMREVISSFADYSDRAIGDAPRHTESGELVCIELYTTFDAQNIGDLRICDVTSA